MSNKDLRRPATAEDKTAILNADIQTTIECFMLAAIALERGLGRIQRWRSTIVLPNKAVSPADALLSIGSAVHQLLLQNLADGGFISPAAPSPAQARETATPKTDATPPAREPEQQT